MLPLRSEFDGNLLTVGEALNLHREKVTLRDEASARMYIKAGLKVYYTFLNSEDNLGFPGALAVFIQDKGGPVKALGDAAVRLLEPAVITSLFNDCLLELADDPAFEHLTRNGSGAYDHLRGRNVRFASATGSKPRLLRTMNRSSRMRIP